MKNGKVEKLVCSLNDKKEHIVHLRTLEQAINHGLVLKKVHRAIKLNQEARLKAYIDMNLELRKKCKIWLGKNFFKASE